MDGEGGVGGGGVRIVSERGKEACSDGHRVRRAARSVAVASLDTEGPVRTCMRD